MSEPLSCLFRFYVYACLCFVVFQALSKIAGYKHYHPCFVWEWCELVFFVGLKYELIVYALSPRKTVGYEHQLTVLLSYFIPVLVVVHVGALVYYTHV